MQPVASPMLQTAQVAAAPSNPLSLAMAQQLLLAQLAAQFSQSQGAVQGLGMPGAAAFGGMGALGLAPTPVAPVNSPSQNMGQMSQQGAGLGLGARDQDQRQSTSMLNNPMSQVGAGPSRSQGMQGGSSSDGKSSCFSVQMF